jgi:conjugal transfer/entry exclusion protein
MQKKLVLSLVCLLLWTSRATPQALVYDPVNFVENAISAVQAVLTTIQTVLIEANQILELTPLDDVMVAGGIAEDMAMLGLLLEQVEGLSYDLNSLEAQIASLFALDTAPDTRDGLTERMAELKRLKFESYRYAAKVQTLLTTAARTIEHLTGLLDTVAALIGNLQGNQTHGQFQSVLGKHLANLDVQQAAFQRAQTVDKLSEALIIESINRIQDRRMEDWPTW